MIQTWKLEPKYETYNTGFPYWSRSSHTSYPVEKTTEVISDKNTKWKRGDIVLFNDYLGALPNGEDRFMTKQDRKNFFQYRATPNYAKEEYAMILNRYRITKKRYWDPQEPFIFRDYGSCVMFLTGTKVTNIKRCYAISPYTLVSRFPHSSISSHDEILDVFHNLDMIQSTFDLYQQYGNTEEGRTLLIEKFQKRLHEVNNIL